MTSPRYEHRQIGWGFILPIALLIIPFLLVVMIAQGTIAAGVLLSLLIAIIYGSFATLRTSVDRKEVRISWTWGKPGRRIPITDIESHAKVRNRWWHGWGIRLIPGGMLYSLWGLDAVEIHYRDKKKGKTRMFRVGTNDVDGLDRAITEARAAGR